MEQPLLYHRRECPVCGSDSFRPYSQCIDYTVSKETFTIGACGSCNFKYTNPIPQKTVLGRYYQAEEYISHSATKKGLIARVYHAVRNYTLGKKLRLVKKYAAHGTILDYGCGTGNFLEVCRDAGWQVRGVEPDAGARARVPAGIPVVSDLVQLGQVPEKYAAITLWHVLEHVYDLKETLDFFRSNLAANGVLVVAVPNYRSYDAEYYGKYWAAYDVPRHLYHFDQTSMERLLTTSGFRLEQTLPMPFDSFYVSMLSEKYAHGKISWLKAFKTGLQSNRMAAKSGEYSSLIYIFRPA